MTRMEELGHDFFVFVNAEDERIAVLYRRNDGDYGLIEPTVGGGLHHRGGGPPARPDQLAAPGPQAVDAGLALHEPVVDEVAAQRRDVRVEQRQAPG